MKNILTVFSIMIFLLACEQVSCGCVHPEFEVFGGQWKLVKITYGFPAIDSPTFTTNVPNETYSFNTSKLTYDLSVNGKVTESGKYELGTIDRGNGVVERKITFSTNNTFSTYSFSTDNQELIMYQRTPVGVFLADGNSFHYQKVK